MITVAGSGSIEGPAAAPGAAEAGTVAAGAAGAGAGADAAGSAASASGSSRQCLWVVLRPGGCNVSSLLAEIVKSFEVFIIY